MSTQKYEYADRELVWAKLRGHPEWPALIVNNAPPNFANKYARVRGARKCVMFFGILDFAWVEPNNVKPWDGPWLQQLLQSPKQKNYNEAVRQATNYKKPGFFQYINDHIKSAILDFTTENQENNAIEANTSRPYDDYEAFSAYYT